MYGLSLISSVLENMSQLPVCMQKATLLEIIILGHPSLLPDFVDIVQLSLALNVYKNSNANFTFSLGK